MEIAVVGQGQALLEREERRHVPGDRGRPPARQLGDVRVLLLRQRRRSRRVGIGERGPSELLGGPQHQLLGEAGQVRHGLGAAERVLGDEVARRHRVQRVVERGGEAQLGGHRLRVER